MNTTPNRFAKMSAVLRRGWINLELRRRGKGWIAITDQGERLSTVAGYQTKTELKEWLRSRYLADVYVDSAHINTRWALKNPRFAGHYGGLHELANSLRAA